MVAVTFPAPWVLERQRNYPPRWEGVCLKFDVGAARSPGQVFPLTLPPTPPGFTPSPVAACLTAIPPLLKVSERNDGLFFRYGRVRLHRL